MTRPVPVTVRGDAGDVDVQVDLDAGLTLADLVGVTRPVHDSAKAAAVDGEMVPLPTALHLVGLRPGSVIDLTRAIAPPRRPPARAQVRVVGGLLAGTTVDLPDGASVLGRRGAVVLDAPTVSDRHAAVVVGPGGVTIEDLGSHNGTFVDGVPSSGRVPVGPDATIELGAVQLTIAPPPPDDRPTAPPPPNGPITWNRPPRTRPGSATDPIRLPDAVAPLVPATAINAVAVAAPLGLGVLLALVLDPRYALFVLVSPIVLLATQVAERRRARRSQRQHDRARQQALARLHGQLAAARYAARQELLDAHPDPAEVVRRAVTPSVRLWERRPPDGPLRLRLGTGTVDWHPPVNGDLPPDVAMLVGAADRLPAAPITVDLPPGTVLGIAGERAVAVSVVRSLLCQAAVLHGPADLALEVRSDDGTGDDWRWTRWLPHRLADPTIDAAGLVVVDGPLDRSSRDLLRAPGIAGIVLAASVDRLPSMCGPVLELRGRDGLATLTAHATTIELLVAGMPAAIAERCGRVLARFVDPGLGDGHDPSAEVHLLDLLGLTAPTPDAVLARWRSHADDPAPTARIGSGPAGALDLDLVAAGPHALVAGTTGAGKSELLRALVLSLAATYAPARVTFVLIDYKGGSAFDACADLPHTVGLVTDLDEGSAARALRGLEAELHRRERVLRDLGVGDLTEVDDRDPPLPRLVLVIDELAALVADLPDFVSALVDIAQRGRSLGVHLVLATQRPAGAVSDHVRANVDLRIALRLQDRADSLDVLGTEEAAALPRTAPGRALVRLGPQDVRPFRSARTTTTPATRAPIRPWPAPDEVAAPTGPTDLHRLVSAVREAHVRSGAAPPRPPWTPPLPTELAAEQLEAQDEADGAGAPVALADDVDGQRRLVVRWDPSDGNLALAGAPGHGRTSALLTLVTGVAARTSAADLHVHVLDLGAGALTALEVLPHVGSVVRAGDRERQERLLRDLRRELERRRASRDPQAPAIVLAVDGYDGLAAAFADVHDLARRDDLVRLAADGPARGITVVVTADRLTTLPLTLSGVIDRTWVFHLADRHDLAMVGVAPTDAPDPVPGRFVDTASGLIGQVAWTSSERIRAVAAASDVGPSHRLPTPVRVLPDRVALADVAAAADLHGEVWSLPVGLGDHDLAPVGFVLGPGEHALVAGPPRSGRSTLLATIGETVASQRPDVAVLACAPRPSPLGGTAGVRCLDGRDLVAAMAGVDGHPEGIVLLIDDAEHVDDPDGTLARLLHDRHPKVRIVAAGRTDALRTGFGHWTDALRRGGQAVLLRPHRDVDGDLIQARLPRRSCSWPAGRGELVRHGACELIQAAVPRTG